MKPNPKRRSKVERELLERRRIGAQLATCAFNLAQDDALPESTRATLKNLQRQWDAIERTKKVKP